MSENKLNEFEKKVSIYEKEVDQDDDKSSQIDKFIILLDENKIDSDEAIAYKRLLFIRSLKVFLGVFLIVIGAAAILLPLPGNLEVKTLYYFSDTEGITISDVLGFAVICWGVYVSASKPLR